MVITAEKARELASGATGNVEFDKVMAFVEDQVVKAAQNKAASCVCEFTEFPQHSGNRTHLAGVRMIDEIEDSIECTETANLLKEELERNHFTAQIVDRSLVVMW